MVHEFIWTVESTSGTSFCEVGPPIKQTGVLLPGVSLHVDICPFPQPEVSSVSKNTARWHSIFISGANYKNCRTHKKPGKFGKMIRYSWLASSLLIPRTRPTNDGIWNRDPPRVRKMNYNGSQLVEITAVTSKKFSVRPNDTAFSYPHIPKSDPTHIGRMLTQWAHRRNSTHFLMFESSESGTARPLERDYCFISECCILPREDAGCILPGPNLNM